LSDERLEGDEVEVTIEMTRAGVAELIKYNWQSETEEAVTRIFASMTRARAQVK